MQSEPDLKQRCHLSAIYIYFQTTKLYVLQTAYDVCVCVCVCVCVHTYIERELKLKNFIFQGL